MFQSQTIGQNHNHNHNNRYSTSSKSLGDIKRDKLLNPDPQMGFIDRMYESGGKFHYEAPISSGSYMTQLNSMEDTSKKLVSDCTVYKEEIFQLRNQINSLKSYMTNSFQEMKKSITTNVDDLEIKTKVSFNKQKIYNVQINHDVISINKEFNELKDIVSNLKERLELLKSILII